MKKIIAATVFACCMAPISSIASNEYKFEIAEYTSIESTSPVASGPVIDLGSLADSYETADFGGDLGRFQNWVRQQIRNKGSNATIRRLYWDAYGRCANRRDYRAMRRCFNSVVR